MPQEGPLKKLLARGKGAKRDLNQPSEGVSELIAAIAQILRAMPQPGARVLSGPVSGAANLSRLFTGRPSETGYRRGVSEAVYNAVTPYSYSTNPAQITDAIARISSGSPGADPVYTALGQGPPPEGSRAGLHPHYEDPWKLYLGLPQREEPILVPSEFKPSKSKDPSATYYDFSSKEKEEWRGEGVMDSDKVIRALNQIRRTGGPIRGGQVGSIARDGSGDFELPNPVTEFLPMGPTGVMANYTVDKGEDEVGPYLSYYDKWDLPHKVARLAKGVGKPFEIYGRIYYDPKTFEPLSDEEVERRRTTVT